MNKGKIGFYQILDVQCCETCEYMFGDQCGCRYCRLAKISTEMVAGNEMNFYEMVDPLGYCPKYQSKIHESNKD